MPAVGIHLERHLGTSRAVHAVQVADQFGWDHSIGPALHEQHRRIGNGGPARLIGGEHVGQRADRRDAVPAAGVAHCGVVEIEERLEDRSQAGLLDDPHPVDGLSREVVLEIEVVMVGCHGIRRHHGEALRRGADGVHQPV